MNFLKLETIYKQELLVNMNQVLFIRSLSDDELFDINGNIPEDRKGSSFLSLGGHAFFHITADSARKVQTFLEQNLAIDDLA